jgi:membrane protein
MESETAAPASSQPSLLRAVFDESYEDDVLGHAAQLAFYFLFALFPMLIFLAALVGYLPIPHLLERMLIYLRQVLPPTALALVTQTLSEITQQRVGLLSFGFIATIWAASSGLHALIYSLNIAYGVKKLRPWWRERSLALLLTFVFSALIISALILIFFGENLGVFLANTFHLGSTFRDTWLLLQWPVAILFTLFCLDLIYFAAPNIPRRWKWVTPGTIFALVSWLLISYAFKLYVTRISNYTLTYGSLGSLMALMFWLYLTSLVILIGGEINNVVEQRRKSRTSKADFSDA